MAPAILLHIPIMLIRFAALSMGPGIRVQMHGAIYLSLKIKVCSNAAPLLNKSIHIYFDPFPG